MKLITYSTPKKLQPKYGESDNRWHSKLRKFCKSSKSEHQFTTTQYRACDWADGRFVINICVCGKKKITWEDNK